MNFIEILQREDNCLSLPRICAFIGFIVLCGMMIAELFGYDAKHLPEFMAFESSMFAFCCGSKYLDIKKDGVKNVG